MGDLVGTQGYAFLIYILSGIIIGIFFDVFRVLRKSFKTSDLVTSIEDFIFWLLTGAFLLYVIFKFNNGEIRAYIFLGLGVGIGTYILLFSKHFININVKIVNLLKLIVSKITMILLLPLRLLAKLFLKPISFIIINVKKSFKNAFGKLSKLTNNVKKSKKFTKKQEEKKDFI